MKTHTVALAMAVVAVVVAGAMGAEGALPPRSSEELAVAADAVFEGRIVRVESSVERREKGGGEDVVYVVDVEVGRVLKGEAVEGSVVQVAHWRSHWRPRGWVGNTGSRGDFLVRPSLPGELVLFHATARAGTPPIFDLLLPNGAHVVTEPEL